MEPAVLTAAFELPSGSATSTIDLSQVACLLNRRFYRQGINWAVAGFKVISPGGAVGSLSIAQLPNTWVLSNAWEKGMRAWTRMIREALSESDSLRPKFLDFKIYADNEHHSAGYGDNLLPVDFAGTKYDAGEWVSSVYEIPVTNADPTLPAGNSVTRDIVAVGANYSAVGNSGNYAVSLIEGYASSRALPNEREPNMPDDASSAAGSLAQNWLTAIFNDGVAQNAEIIQDLETQNNQAPYPFEGDGINTDTMYPGGANQAPTLQYHDSAIISGTTIGGTTSLKGGNFPCGLIRISSTIDLPGTILQVNLVPGNHRGYLCEPMTEM